MAGSPDQLWNRDRRWEGNGPGNGPRAFTHKQKKLLKAHSAAVAARKKPQL